MISQKTYTPEWIKSFRDHRQYRAADPAIFEKMIYAFSLLELLASSGLDFIFKGGTSLMLMPIGSRRFSIDIDIITQHSKKDLESAIDEQIKSSVFTSYREDAERANAHGIPKAHYIFDFKPAYNQSGNILLDVLFEKNPYVALQQVPIQCQWIDTAPPIQVVNVPTINSILGDKLTAFAPSTIGVPYWLGDPDKPDKRIEIIKQLLDVSGLIDYCSDIAETKTVFQAIAGNQFAYRQLNIGMSKVIDDVFQAALILAKRENNREESAILRFADLQNGIKMFSGYLISGYFRIEEAIAASAKATYFVHHIMQETPGAFALFADTVDMTDWNIENPDFNFLNRFKRTNRPAFFYWYNALQLSGRL